MASSSACVPAKTVRFATSVVELIPHHWTMMNWWLVIIVISGFIKHATCRYSKVCPKASSSALYVWKRKKKGRERLRPHDDRKLRRRKLFYSVAKYTAVEELPLALVVCRKWWRPTTRT